MMTTNPADRLACGDPVAYPTPAGGATGTVDTIRYAPGGVIVDRITVRTDADTLATFPAADVEALEEEPCGDCGRPVYYDERAQMYRHALEPMRSCFLIRAHDGVADYPIVDELAARGITDPNSVTEAHGFRLGHRVARRSDPTAVGTVVAFNSRSAEGLDAAATDGTRHDGPGYLVGVRLLLTPGQMIVRYFTADELEAR